MLMQIEKGNLKESLNYNAKCPAIKPTSFQQRVVTALFQKLLLLSNSNLPFLHRLTSKWSSELKETPSFPSDNNAPTVCVTHNGTPHFSIDYIQITELIQKEDIILLEDKIHTFLRKNCEITDFPSSLLFDITDILGHIASDHSSFPIGSGQFSKSSSLFRNFSSISFSVCNLTSTFCSLHIYVKLSYNLRKSLSVFSTSNIPAHLTVKAKHISDLITGKGLGYEIYMGSIYKHDVLRCVIQDLTWQITSQLVNQHTPLIISPRQSFPPHILHVSTNISGNYNKEFWNSIGVKSSNCDYHMNVQQCLSWSSIPMYIQLTEAPPSRSSPLSHPDPYIIDRYWSYINISKFIDSHIRNEILPYMRKINVFQRSFFMTPFNNPLKLKCKIDQVFFPYLRFLKDSETILSAKHPGIIYCYNYQKLPLRKTNRYASILEKNKHDVLKMNQRLCKDYNQFYQLLTSAVDVYKDNSNHKLQVTAIIVSIIAILISVALEIDVIELINSVCHQIRYYASSIINTLKSIVL